MFTRKDRKIANLEAMVKNRDKLINDQDKLINTMKKVIDSLIDDNKSLLAESYKTAKKRTSRPTKSN